jgi:hypothetical protein
LHALTLQVAINVIQFLGAEAIGLSRCSLTTRTSCYMYRSTCAIALSYAYSNAYAFVRILTHVGIFLCILTHHEAVMKQVSCYHRARVAHPNQAMFLLRELEYELMHMNARI